MIVKLLSAGILIFILSSCAAVTDAEKIGAFGEVLYNSVMEFSDAIYTDVGFTNNVQDQSQVSANVSFCSDGTEGTPYIKTAPLALNLCDSGTATIDKYDYCDTASLAEDYIISFTATVNNCKITTSFDYCADTSEQALEIDGTIQYDYKIDSDIAFVSGNLTITIGKLEAETCPFSIAVYDASSGYDTDSAIGSICNGDIESEDVLDLSDEDLCGVILN